VPWLSRRLRKKKRKTGIIDEFTGTRKRKLAENKKTGGY